MGYTKYPPREFFSTYKQETHKRVFYIIDPYQKIGKKYKPH